MSWRYVGRRLIQLVVVLLIVTFFSFMLINLLPGDPVDNLCTGVCDEEQEAQIRQELNLDEGVIQRYFDWLGGILSGDFGRYYDSGVQVSQVLESALPVSLQLMIYTQIIALAIAIPMGVITAYRSGSVFDRSSNAAAFGFLALPNYVLAFYLISIFALGLAWFPPGGYVYFSDNPVEHFKSMFLPVLALAAGQVAVYMRLLRSDMIQTLQEDYITMAKAKGMPPRRVLFRHALRPSSLTLLTVAGLNVGTLIGGAVIIEVLFELPGMGTQIFLTINTSEYVALQSYIAIIGIAYVLINFSIDFAYSLIDPRIRHG